MVKRLGQVMFHQLVKQVEELHQVVMEQLEVMESHLELNIGHDLLHQLNKVDIIEDRFIDS